MATKAIGLYVHIPFCVRKCNYCDFCSFSVSDAHWRDEYIERLCHEILSYKEKALTVDSIFFGGGTPSLLTPDEFEKIFNCIKESFEISANVEFSVESNPKTLNEEKLASFKKCGVNRISLGLQTTHENELKILGRIHNYADFVDSFELCRKMGFVNINIDLMYAIPGQSVKSFGETLSRVLDLSPEHISLYGLILEEGTAFYENRKNLVFPGEDSECEMYDLATRMLKERGYLHYEISNYAKPGFECRHNLKYWHSEEYVGVGVSAYSYLDSNRFGRGRDPKVYLSSCGEQYEYIEKIDSHEEAYEYVMLGLRLADGISLSEYKNRFGCDFLFGREEKIRRLEEQGYLTILEDRISLTESGFYISNYILNELI